MKTTTAFIFLATFVAITRCLHAEDAAEDAKTEKHVNAGTHPYLFFIEQNGENTLFVYEQWVQKKSGDPSVLTVIRTVDGKTDAINFTVKVEALKEGLCRFRILGHKDGDPTLTKAKELLGIKSNFFEIRFRENPGQMHKSLLSVKDSNTNEQDDAKK